MTIISVDDFQALTADKKEAGREWLKANGIGLAFQIDVLSPTRYRVHEWATRDGKRYANEARTEAVKAAPRVVVTPTPAPFV
jgi:hypothetical protein